jgi:hypothetical protein
MPAANPQDGQEIINLVAAVELASRATNIEAATQSWSSISDLLQKVARRLEKYQNLISMGKEPTVVTLNGLNKDLSSLDNIIQDLDIWMQNMMLSPNLSTEVKLAWGIRKRELDKVREKIALEKNLTAIFNYLIYIRMDQEIKKKLTHKQQTPYQRDRASIVAAINQISGSLRRLDLLGNSG